MRTIRKLKKYRPTKFKAKTSVYDKDSADYAVMFIESLCHTKGTWAGKPFELIDWQEQIIRDIFGTLKPNGYRQFNTAYIEIPKKMGKSELAAAVGVNLSTVGNWERSVTCPDAEQAWNCAVALGCTPNDIVGWYETHPRESDGERLTSEEHEIVGCYRESTPQWRQNIAMTARAAAGESKETAKRDIPPAEERQAM